MKRYVNLIILLLNVLLIAAGVFFYMQYTSAYDDRSKDENINRVVSINQYAVLNATAVFENWNIKLKDAVQYIEKTTLNEEDALEYLRESNSNSERYFQLIRQDKSGYLVRAEAASVYVNYGDASYNAPVGNILSAPSTDKNTDSIRLTGEFNSSGDKPVKCFALYRYVNIDVGGTPTPYTLLLCIESEAFSQLLNVQSTFDNQGTVIIDKNGYFINNDHYYQATNLFNNLETINRLSAADKKELINDVNTNKEGLFYYKRIGRTEEEEFVFCYQVIENLNDEELYCVTCVPLSSFPKPEFNFGYLVVVLVCIIALFVTDIVWLNFLNTKLKKSFVQEQKANNSKTMFLSRMSHEIRTPLNAIIGYNTIARNDMTTAKSDIERRQATMKVMDCLSKSDIASKHLLSIINDVLDMSAIDSGKINIAHSRFDFRGLIASLTTVFYSQARSKDVNFEVLFSDMTEEWFVGDSMRINQILTNLLSNSIKFTPAGGSVTLRISQGESNSKSTCIHFEVQDTGIGMSQEYLYKIWTPFEQADSSISRRFGGTGLGLSITKSLVDLLGGTIAVDSQLGVGTTFKVDVDFDRVEQPSLHSPYDFSKINALVVDDDVSTCEYVRLLFNHYGTRCATVNSGMDAIKAISVAQEQDDQYSICLVDWRMPEMDGIETIKRIRQIAGDDLPIAVLTAYDYSELAEQASQIGVTMFINKPLFQSTLFDLLANICGIKVEEKPIVKAIKRSYTHSRVLLVEDNAMNMEIAKMLLADTGVQVDTAWNGKQAIEAFNNVPAGTYMAIFMDVHMPEMDGLEATRIIRKSTHPEAKTIPIIALTANAFAENIAETKEAGMNDHISKPIDVRTLNEIVDKLLKGANQ